MFLKTFNLINEYTVEIKTCFVPIITTTKGNLTLNNFCFA